MKRNFSLLAIAVFFILSVGYLCHAQADETKLDFLEGSEKHVSIDLRDSDIVDVLKFLAQKGNYNVFISRTIQGRVSLYLRDVKISDILNIVLLSNGLAEAHNGSIVYIMTQDEYKGRYGADYGDTREVRKVHLKYADPGQVFKMLEPTKSKIGSVVVDELSGTMILIETPDKMKFMLGLIQELDQPLETRFFDLSYAKAADAQALLSSQSAGGGSVSIHSDVRSNQIIVTALPTRMREIVRMIEKIDRKTREVAIDAQIIKIDLSNHAQAGINWSKVYQTGALEPLSLNVALPATLGTSLASVQYNSVTRNGFDILYQFLKTLGESKVLASPRITVVEGEEAKILIGTRQAYVTSTTTTGTSTNTISENVSFIDVGISLSVSAAINKEGYVTMKIKPEVSSVSSTLVTPSNNKIPIVDTTHAETRVMVKDGTTIVIGGLRKDEKTRTSNQIPFFSDLPLVGKLFKSNDNAINQSELVVFLTPHIIEGSKSMYYDQDRTPKPIKSYFVPTASDQGSTMSSADEPLKPSKREPLALKDLAMKGA